MKYSIVQIPKQPEFVVVDGPLGQVSRKNINPACDRPATGVQCLYYDHSGFYGDDPTRRVELWENTSGTTTDAEIFAACPGLRDTRAALIRAAGNERLLAIANPYQPAERETWPIQVTEAEKWLANNAAETPMIDAICAGRGIGKAELIGYVMNNTDLFRAASGMILGMQQALLMRIYTAATVDELFSVAW